MGILNRMVTALRTPANGNGPPWNLRAQDYVPSSQLNKPQWPRRNISTYSDNAFTQIALIFRCIAVTANAIAAAPVKVYKDTGGGQREEDQTHALRQLMIRPNPFWGEVRFLSTVAMVASVTGFCVVEKERSNAGRVIALYPLRSDWLKPIPRTNAAPDWEYRIPGYPAETVSADDVLVFTYADATDYRYTGIGPLEVALREWGILNTMTDFLKAFFDTGATPQLGLVPDPNAKKYSQPEADTLIEKFKQKSGLANSLNPVFLQGISDVKRLGFDFNELAYTDLRDVSETAVCEAFGVPPGLVGTLAGMARNTFSNYAEQRRSFYEDTITPLWARLDDTLTYGLLSEFETRPGYSLEFDTSNVPALQEDVTPTWQRATAALQASGITRNDFRREVGLAPVTGGDVFLASIATVEVPAVEEGQNGNRSNGHVIDYDDDDLPIEFLGGRTLTHAQMAEQMRAVKAIVGQNGHAWLSTGMMRRLPAEQRARVAATNKQHIVKIGERGAVWLRKFWRDQGERIIADWGLRSLPDHTPSWWTGDMSVVERRAIEQTDWDEEERLLAQQLGQIHHLAGKTAYQQASDVLGINVEWNLANPNVQRVLDRLAQRVGGINESTRADVQRVIGDSLQQGASLSDIADNLRGLFTETYTGRAEAVGRTESMVAYGAGSVEAYRDSGVVEYCEISDNPSHVDDYGADDGLTCATRDGITVPLDDVMFHIESDHPNGSAVAIPLLSTPLGEGEG